ncbi:hypothetical protein [Mucilaginibacter sp. KACC 22063]|uniref:hypothetical protein n=1 Tax=Mucilaginibacter sp. KACC 22063 TaxID=3025666 RepID=UPI002366BF54|nr:hypothetical protein [Mucilaginibacter sp. KACC 22063]WDF56221.1 hypothetical protein PQ461_04000 [Mucilaginibacter sp. KACC 22063]
MSKDFEEDIQQYVENSLKANQKNDGTFDKHAVELYSELFNGLSAEPMVLDFNLADDLAKLVLARQARKNIVSYYVSVSLIILSGGGVFFAALSFINNSLLMQIFLSVKVHALNLIFIIICIVLIQAADKHLLRKGDLSI